MENSIIVGDLNGYISPWHSCIEKDQRGSDLSSQIEISAPIVIKEELPTQIASTNRSSPDVSLAHASLVMQTGAAQQHLAPTICPLSN